MAVSGKRAKKPKVVIEEVDSDQTDEVEDESEKEEELEAGDDMVEIKEEVEDSDDGDLISDSQKMGDDSFERKSEDDVEIKEESSDEREITSDEISDDSDVNIDDDSEDEGPDSAEKELDLVANQTVESSDESETESDESGMDSDEDEKTELKKESDTEDSKSGLANVMAQILSTQGDHSVILSKAKKDYEIVKKEVDEKFEVVDADGNVKSEVKIKVEDEVDQIELGRKKLLQKEALIKKLKLMPDFEADREKEKILRKIATQGVVQLFTAIQKHKVEVKKRRLETKSLVDREEIPTSIIKDSFLNILDKEGEKLKKKHGIENVKTETKEQIDLLPAAKKPKWNVFADNFYKEPTLQGWDAKSDEED